MRRRASSNVIAPAQTARDKQASIAVFLPRLIPRLQFEIAFLGRRSAKSKRNAMIQFEVDKKLLGDFQLANQLDLDSVRVAGRRPNGLRPAR